jgi:protein-export membrane protein SecD/preprotein translocase SecF subunit
MVRLNRWWIGLIVLVVAGAIFVDAFGFFYRYVVSHAHPTDNPHIGSKDIYIHKGLDLQGGTELTIAICRGLNNPPGTNCRTGPPKGHAINEIQDNTITVLTQRVNSLGVAESTVQAQGNDEVLVQLPGIGLDQATQAIGTTAKLHFATAVPGPPPDGPPDPVKDKQFLADQENLYDVSQFKDPQYYPGGYHWKIDNAIDASDVTKADVGTDQTGQLAVDITFNSHGADEWSKITQAAFSKPQQSPDNRIAIFLDNKVITAPSVQQPSSNQTQITGNFTSDEATRLASQISAGALPADIATVQSSVVSATLGQDTVKKSLVAGAVGLLVVVIFMIAYYRFPGLLASIALLLYAAIVLALYKLIPVTVTLAGLAGFVLSVGMAVDANVLIFERVRDELRHGRGVAVAVEAGFRRAFPAIRDSNFSTIIACAVLWVFGTSVVKGFALTLGLGVVVSFFSAILITQSLLVWALHTRRGRNPRLYTEIHEEYVANPPAGRFDIVRSRNLYFLGSLAIIIPGILAILFWGFRLGIDFAGGNRIDVGLRTPTNQAQVTATMESVAKDLRPEVQAESRNHFSIRTLPSPIDRVQKITTALDDRYHFAKDSKGKPDVQVQTVGPTIATDLVTKAVILIIASSALIAAYLAFAFRKQRSISPWRFSACTFFKLLHDVFVLAGIWAIIGHFSTLGEVDLLFVTAVLTSVVFSIHDTIVVFDRVRENLRHGPRLTFDQVINLSTLQTMTRSLNTTLTVVFVLLAMVVFGGGSIRGFVLALLIGIATGTYSSLFNASTLLVAWQSADKERSAATPPAAAGHRRVQRAAV